MKIFAIATLALALAVSAFAQTTDGPTTTVRQNGQVLVTNTGSYAINVRFVQPSYATNLELGPGESRLVGSNEAYWEWTCASGQPILPATGTAPFYSDHGTSVVCR